MLSIKDEYILGFLSFLLIGLCSSSANACFSELITVPWWGTEFLSKTYKL